MENNAEGIAIEIVDAHDWNDDHEVGGQDLPVTYTANVHGGTVDDALGLMNAGCGNFGKLCAFDIEAKSPTQVSFTSFETLRCEQFHWQDNLELEKMKMAIQGKVFHYIRRQAHVALMNAISQKPTYARVRWWDRLHSDPDLPSVFDKNGVRIDMGQRCCFDIPDRNLRGTGWVWNIDSRAGRHIAVYDDTDAQVEFGIGAKPSEIEIIADDEEFTSIKAMFDNGVFPKGLVKFIRQRLDELPEADCEYLSTDEKIRWSIQLAELTTKYQALENLAKSYQQ